MTSNGAPAYGRHRSRFAASLRAARSPSFLLGAGWAAVAVAQARRRLRGGSLDVVVVRPPITNARARRGVSAVIGRLSPTCLERSLVLQRWLAACGQHRDVVVGVKVGPDGAFSAHAWLDGEPGGAGDFQELHRLPAR